MTSASTSIGTTQPEPRQRRAGEGLGLFFCMLGITALVITGVVLLLRRAQASYERQQLQARIDAVAASGSIVVSSAADEPDLVDPDSPAWANVRATAVRVGPQNLAMPMLEQPTIQQVSLQSIATPTRIGFRLTWEDPQADYNVDSGRFCDAIAIQLPLAADAPIMMGSSQVPVQILLWKAIWQKDIDQHFQDVQDVHPNYWADQYWFAKPATTRPTGEMPYRVPESFQDPRSQVYFPAKQAGNPNSQWTRTQPVEELSAEGFGSLSTQKYSVTQGRGIWKDGKWTVTFVRPLRTDDAFDVQIFSSGQLALAVWDGGSGNVGGRKHYSQWTNYQVVR